MRGRPAPRAPDRGRVDASRTCSTPASADAVGRARRDVGREAAAGRDRQAVVPRHQRRARRRDAAGDVDLVQRAGSGVGAVAHHEHARSVGRRQRGRRRPARSRAARCRRSGRRPGRCPDSVASRLPLVPSHSTFLTPRDHASARGPIGSGTSKQIVGRGRGAAVRSRRIGLQDEQAAIGREQRTLRVVVGQRAEARQRAQRAARHGLHGAAHRPHRRRRRRQRRRRSRVVGRVAGRRGRRPRRRLRGRRPRRRRRERRGRRGRASAPASMTVVPPASISPSFVERGRRQPRPDASINTPIPRQAKRKARRCYRGVRAGTATSSGSRAPARVRRRSCSASCRRCSARRGRSAGGCRSAIWQMRAASAQMLSRS